MSENSSRNLTKALNPANGRVLGYSRLHTRDELKKMISQAREAKVYWGSISVKKRVRHLKKIQKFLVQKSEALASVIADDNGKTRLEALATEVIPAAMGLNYYCRHAKSFLSEKSLAAGNIMLVNKRSRVARVPYGVIGIISPWNYPFSIAFPEVVMGLLAGNAVILKTASETQMAGLALKEAFEAAELPEGIFNFLNLPGRVAGDALLEDGVDKLFFTGSVPVGKKLMKKASETLTPVCLELGGNDAMIVCSDADPERAAAGAVWAGFQNAGQSCGGVERIYVHEKVYEPFLEALKARTETLRVGKGTHFDTDMGVMTTEKQIATVKTHVEDALEKGAKMYARSADPDDKELKNVHPAMVLTDVNHDMLVMRDETFGPVVAVMKVASEEEAVRLANDSYLGLTGSVWSRSRRKAMHIARQIRAGAVTINDHLMSHGLAETSWGGFKESGIGRTHGELGFNEMTQPQMLIDDILPRVKKDLWWHPYSEKVYLGLKGLMDFLYAATPAKRMTGLWRLLRILPRMFSTK